MQLDDNGAKKKKSKVSTTSAEPTPTKEDLSALSLEDLNKLLNEVLEQEDYIRAISIRDEIKSRTNK
jgi:protein-arginine kinase activator protein McsA